MKEIILVQIVKPLLHRVASLASVSLAALGLSSQQIDTVEAAVVIIGGVAVDFLVRKVI